jgi:hypothetical protein
MSRKSPNRLSNDKLDQRDREAGLGEGGQRWFYRAILSGKQVAWDAPMRLHPAAKVRCRFPTPTPDMNYGQNPILLAVSYRMARVSSAVLYFSRCFLPNPASGLRSPFLLSGCGRNCPLPNISVGGRGLRLRQNPVCINWHICWRAFIANHSNSIYYQLLLNHGPHRRTYSAASGQAGHRD